MPSPAGLKKLQEYFAEIMSEVGISGGERLIVYEDALNKGYGQQNLRQHIQITS